MRDISVRYHNEYDSGNSSLSDDTPYYASYFKRYDLTINICVLYVSLFKRMLIRLEISLKKTIFHAFFGAICLHYIHYSNVHIGFSIS